MQFISRYFAPIAPAWAAVGGVVLIALLLGLSTGTAHADYVVGTYEVRHEKALGRISIESGMLRGKAAHQRAKRHRRKLEKRGLYLADQGIRKVFRR